jgi:DNA polymerase-3 subunit epsilon
MTLDFIPKARQEAARKTRAILRREFVVFDTETTGLEAEDCRIVSIGICDHTGRVLLDTLINPGEPIPGEATQIHGITDEMVKDAPMFRDVWPAIYDALDSRVWVGYNIHFDQRFLWWECNRAGLRMPPAAQECWKPGESLRWEELHDVMQLYAEFFGAFSDYHGSFTWQKLVNACKHLGIEIGQAHHALHDALATLAVLRGMAIYE